MTKISINFSMYAQKNLCIIMIWYPVIGEVTCIVKLKVLF